MAPVSDPPSRTSTPRSFATQTSTAEDLLKHQTVGLVHLSEFRKRRADALEQKEKEAQDKAYGRLNPGTSGTTTPDVEENDGILTPATGLPGRAPKRQKKKAAKGQLSFGNDEEDDGQTASMPDANPLQDPASQNADFPVAKPRPEPATRKLKPNPNSAIPAPKILTKASLQAEAVARDNLRREFLAIQEAVKNTEISIPFVFYDGTNNPGGKVKLKKGDHVWLFLERCRKVGAELGISGGASGPGSGISASKNDNRKAWARVGVDDLICVRGDVIIPHHYEFYYFIANKVPNPSGSSGLLFDYSNTADTQTVPESRLLRRPNEDNLEGQDHDPTLTKVVDRRWYEKNKHIYPATLWKEYEAGKEFEQKMAQMRRDEKKYGKNQTDATSHCDYLGSPPDSRERAASLVGCLGTAATTHVSSYPIHPAPRSLSLQPCFNLKSMCFLSEVASVAVAMMDTSLRCNNQNGGCRTQLPDRAVVTTCSHIFCLRCADQLGLTRARAEERSCPACGTSLTHTDDAVTTALQPTEDYKTSVLSGLDPTTIMECAGRALAFWSYQTAQEISYQEYLGKMLTDKYSDLSGSMDKLISEANLEIQNLQQRIGSLGIDHKSLQQKNAELVEMYREKTRKHAQTQHLYDTLKKRVMLSQVQTAASENVNQTIHSIGIAARPGTYNGTDMRTSKTHGTTTDMRRSNGVQLSQNGVEQLHSRQRAGSGSDHGRDTAEMPLRNPEPNDQRSQNMTAATPMHRQPLAGLARATANHSQIPISTTRPSPLLNTVQQDPGYTIRRQFSQNARGRASSGHYGFSGGVKIGGTQGNGIGNTQRPSSYASAGNFDIHDTHPSGFDRGHQTQNSGPFFR